MFRVRLGGELEALLQLPEERHQQVAVLQDQPVPVGYGAFQMGYGCLEFKFTL